MSELAVIQSHQLTATDIRAQVNLVQQVMQAVMKDGTHYGVIPGTPKPSLWKAGAEVLSATFRIAVSYVTEDLSTNDVVRYRITATGIHQTSGVVMGAGMGECSSGEAKYKWRKATSRREFDATPEDKRRTQYGYDKYKKTEYEVQQVRTEPADLANTVLKMACKRAQVAMILNVTAASDIFTQDIEDLPEELQPHVDTSTGEIKAKKLEALTQAVFDAQKEGWQKAVAGGKKTVDALIAWIEAKGSFLTTDQKKMINSWVPVASSKVDDDFVAAMEKGEIIENA